MFKVVAMYAAAAFIILDILDVATLMLRLPEWTQKFVVVLLAIGFLLTAILAWFYDITSEGLKLTKPLEVSSEDIPEPTPSKRGFRLSDVIIGVLVLVVCILAYPRIFRNKANLKVMTTSLTYKNEFGDKESKRIFKDEFIESLALFGFDNINQDTHNDWQTYALTDALRETLLQFNYLILGPDPGYYPTLLKEQLDWAQANNYPYFLTGSYVVNEDEIKVTSQLYETGPGSLIAERVFSGTDYFSIIDSISFYVRIDMDISPVILNALPDSPSRELLTENQEAWRYVEKWWYPDSGFYYVDHGIALDPAYANARYLRARQLFDWSGSIETTKKYITEAIQNRHRLTDIRDLQVRTLYYRIIGEEEKAIALARIQHEMQPSNPKYLLDLIQLYDHSFLMADMEKAVRKLIKLVPGSTDFKFMLIRCYLHTGKLDKGLKLLNEILKSDPKNSAAIMRTGEFFLHKHDLESAKENFEKAILMSPENEAIWSPMLDHVDYVRTHPDFIDHCKPWVGVYRLESKSELELIVDIHNKQLITRNINRVFDNAYPTSDSTNCDYISKNTSQFLKDLDGKVIRMYSKQFGQTHHLWKEDSDMIRAFEQFDSLQYQEALASFRRAYDANPMHFYLGNYIDHLEVILDEEFDAYEVVLDSFMGSYGDFKLRLYRKNNRFYSLDHQGIIFELLPMTDHRFMVPSFMNMHVQLVLEDELITGLKFVYRNGTEEFMARNS